MPLRKWQEEALEKYRVANPRDFTVTATPGAGKTTFALTLAKKLKEAGQIDKIIVVCPTDHLRTQWAVSGIEMDLFLEPGLPNNRLLIPADVDGYVTTYSQVGVNAAIHRKRSNKQKTLVIFDEIHHAGDGLLWGQSLRLAFSDASRRLSLTGTPFRTGNEIIPFISYEKDSHGASISSTDYSYGYKEALADNVVRPVSFATYSGQAEWVNSAGKQLNAVLGEPMTKAKELEAWRTVLNPRGVWIKNVIAAAHQKLTYVRNTTMPNAAGMILASNKDSARSYAIILENVTGMKPLLVLSDDRKASKKIADFSSSTSPNDQWIVAVRMVSEGVDVPRLAVGIWATSYRTPLFFAQAVGRFIRKKAPQESATVFLPAVKPLLYLAASMEEERNHVVVDDEEEEGAEEPREPREANSAGEFEALSSDGELDHILYNGKAYRLSDLSPDDQEYLGLLGGLLPPEELSKILEKKRTDEKVPDATVEKTEKKNPFEAKDIRRDINKAVSRIALSQNVPYASIHRKIRNAVPGPAMQEASIEVLRKRKQWVMENL